MTETYLVSDDRRTDKADRERLLILREESAEPYMTSWEMVGPFMVQIISTDVKWGPPWEVCSHNGWVICRCYEEDQALWVCQTLNQKLGVKV